jgi:thymidylate synthase
MNLYKPEKYKVIKGPDSEIALCTCWFDPFNILNLYPQILEKINLTGTLYSKEGVSIILRNLALNPNIRYLFVWNNTPLSKTSFGIAGFNLLKNIWENPQEFVKDVHKEIDPETIIKITKNVSLVDLGHYDFSELIVHITNFESQVKEKYMEPINFPEPKRDSSKPLSSERVGFSVRGKSIYSSWLNAIDRVIRYGSIKNTEYGNMQRELQNVNWNITNEDLENPYIPDLPDEVLKIIGLNSISLNQYKETLLNTQVPEGTSYTYGARLGNYGISNFNQIDFIIDKLKESMISRRAIATTIIPEFDSTQKSPPCLSLVQVLSDTEGKLNFFATFRSHDLFKAAIPNAYGLLNLQEYICEKVSMERGILSINSISAHIYEEDWENALNILKCQKWEDVKTRFDENEDIDERGVVKVYLENNEIVLELSDFSGDEVFKAKSKSAREIGMKIAKLHLLSKADHYVDITIELLKAEIALNSNLNYEQDKPIKFSDVVIK